MKRNETNFHESSWEPRKYVRGFVLILAMLAGCASSQPDGELPTVQMTIGSKTYNLEIANTPPTQERGLMRRDSMPADHGMIFVFASDEPREFWMHNTRFDLDILYVASDGHIVSIKHMKAYDESSVPSDGPVKYAIELNSGQAAEAGVKVNDTLTIPDAARNAAQ